MRAAGSERAAYHSATLATASASGHPRVAEGEHRVAAGGEPAGGAEQPLPERLALDRLPARQRQPVGLRGVETAVHRRPGRHRLAGDDVGGGDLDEVPSSLRTVAMPSSHDSQMPSTSVIAGPPVGPVSPGSTASYDDPLADDVRSEPPHGSGSPMSIVGRFLSGHGGILGWPSSAPDRTLRRIQVTYVIAQPCVDLKDRACVDECPVDCIYEGKRMLYIHPDECVDCGACEPVCPVEAIYYEDDTPEEWKEYYDANVHFFDDLGSPGGAAKMGEIDKDHPMIEALPPQPQGSDLAGLHPAPGLPLGPAHAVRREGARPPRRDRRPLDRHSGRPDAGDRAAGTAGRHGRAGLPATRSACRRPGRPASTGSHGGSGSPGSGSTRCCRRSAPRS